MNGKAVEDAVMVALALNSKIQEQTLFFRKNYFYPDMPKNYQISQYDKAGGVPIAIGGFVTTQVNHHEKIVRIRRIQLEEDPAKLVHLGPIDISPYTLIDYNRAGISLLEIVTEPDISSWRRTQRAGSHSGAACAGTRAAPEPWFFFRCRFAATLGGWPHPRRVRGRL